MSTQDILDQLNAYTGSDPWQDVILSLDEYDETATAKLGGVSRFALTDGTVFAYSVGSHGGSAHSPHAAGWYEM
jgi:hypothetical protein